MTWSIRGDLGDCGPGTCDGCGHAVSVHPCHGWSRRWRIQLGRLVWLVRCRCKAPVDRDSVERLPARPSAPEPRTTAQPSLFATPEEAKP